MCSLPQKPIYPFGPAAGQARGPRPTHSLPLAPTPPSSIAVSIWIFWGKGADIIE